MDKYDALKQYKELLDMGIITQEEFDIRKKELLKLGNKQANDPELVKEPEEVKEPEHVKELEQIVEQTDNAESSNKKETGDSRAKKGESRKGLIAVIAVIVLLAACGTAILMLNKEKPNQSADTNETESTDVEQSEEEKVTAEWTFGVITVEDIVDNSDEFTHGLYVVDILNQTLIDSGLQLGDRLLSINGKNVGTKWSELDAVLEEEYNGTGPDDWEIALVVDRNGTEKTIKGTLIEPSKQLEQKTSGTVSFYVDGVYLKMTYDGADEVYFEWD